MTITVTDLFCGCGGSTTGALEAGADVRLAINHWDKAVQTHQANYPHVDHVLTDLHEANPRRFRRTDILLASPECTNHSKAKGKKRKAPPEEQGQLPGIDDGPPLTTEAEERSRCTMHAPLDWMEAHRHKAVILENVVDIQDWPSLRGWFQSWE